MLWCILQMQYTLGATHMQNIEPPVGKSATAFDLQTDIIFGGNGGAKINKFLDCISSRHTHTKLKHTTH